MDGDAEGFVPKEANMNDEISLNETVALKYEQMGFTDPASQSKALTCFYIIQASKLLEMFPGKKFYQPKFLTLSDAVFFFTQEDNMVETRHAARTASSSAGAAFTCQRVHTNVITIFICQRCQGDGKRHGWQFPSIFSH